jgi:hypothetical protein
MDNQLEIVWHQFKTLYDDLMNTYSGSFEDSRHNIHQELGTELWGYPLCNREGAPDSDGSWHVWRLAWPHGYTHVVKIESTQDSYLNILLERLHLQATAPSPKAYQKKKAAEEQERRFGAQKNVQQYKRDVDAENAPFFKKAMDNALSGRLNPTNPTKDAIYSYKGQKNRSRIVRPLDDSEGGLVIPEHLKR